MEDKFNLVKEMGIYLIHSFERLIDKSRNKGLVKLRKLCI